MKSIDRARILSLALAAALVLAGCTSSKTVAGTGHASPSEAPLTPVQLAQADARELLASFAKMPSAVRLTKAPAAVSGQVVVDPEQGKAGRPVELTGWFQLPVAFTVAMTEAEAVAPSWARGASTGDSGNGTEGIGAGRSFPGTIGSRDIDIYTARLTATTSVVQISITEGYRPDKPAAENFPDSGVVQITARPQEGAKPTFTRRITDATTVAKVAGILNALPTDPVQGTLICPGAAGSPEMGPPSWVEIDFSPSAGAAAVIQASLWAGASRGGSWCNGGDTVEVSLGKTSAPVLELYPSDVLARLVQALGLPAGS